MNPVILLGTLKKLFIVVDWNIGTESSYNIRQTAICAENSIGFENLRNWRKLTVDYSDKECCKHG